LPGLDRTSLLLLAAVAASRGCCKDCFAVVLAAAAVGVGLVLVLASF